MCMPNRNGEEKITPAFAPHAASDTADHEKPNPPPLLFHVLKFQSVLFAVKTVSYKSAQVIFYCQRHPSPSLYCFPTQEHADIWPGQTVIEP